MAAAGPRILAWRHAKMNNGVSEAADASVTRERQQPARGDVPPDLKTQPRGRCGK